MSELTAGMKRLSWELPVARLPGLRYTLIQRTLVKLAVNALGTGLE